MILSLVHILTAHHTSLLSLTLLLLFLLFPLLSPLSLYCLRIRHLLVSLFSHEYTIQLPYIFLYLFLLYLLITLLFLLFLFLLICLFLLLYQIPYIHHLSLLLFLFLPSIHIRLLCYYLALLICSHILSLLLSLLSLSSPYITINSHCNYSLSLIPSLAHILTAHHSNLLNQTLLFHLF